MIEFLTTYTLVEIIVFILALLIALKEGWSIIDFFRGKIRKKYESETIEDQRIVTVFKRIDELREDIKEVTTKEKALYDQFMMFKEVQEKHFKEASEKLEILTQSDKDSIKSWIVEKHHFFIKQGWIDDFNMDAIEKRFTHYQIEGGNSYVCDLIQELRKLPNYPRL